jgi:flagellar biosynthesis protein FlhB
MHGSIPVRDAKGPRVVGFQPTVRTEKPSPEQIEEAERQKGAALTSGEIKGMYVSKPGTKLTTFVPKPEQVTDADEELIEALKRSVEESSVAKAAA